MTRDDRDGLDLGFYAALIALGIVLGAWLNVGDAQASEPSPSQVQACAEDDPCWDCSTMGNQQCGPIREDASSHTLMPDTAMPVPAGLAASVWLVASPFLLIMGIIVVMLRRIRS